MKVIKVNTELVNKVSARYGVTPEKYVADSLSVSSGHRVCAHFVGNDETGKRSVFEITQ